MSSSLALLGEASIESWIETLSTAGSETWIAFGGRLHPLLLHAPIGMLAALVALELFGFLRRRPLDRGMRATLGVLTGLAAVLTAASGWTLSGEPGYTGEAFVRHRALGLALAGTAAVMGLAALLALPRAYRITLALCCLLVVPAGHYGATLTHGAGFLFEPFEASDADETPAPAASEAPAVESEGEPATSAPPWYATRIAPLLAARCSQCHGGSKQKGGLALHDPAAIGAGGESGPALVPGDANASRLVQRLRLPLEHDDHMPPMGKMQPAPAQIDELARWIDAGASYEAPVPSDLTVKLAPAAPPAKNADAAASAPVSASPPQDAVPAPESPSPEPPPAPPTGPSPDAAVEALRSHQVHVESVEPEGFGLWVDLRAVPELAVAEIAPGLTELGPWVLELSLAGVTHAAEFLTVAPALTRLERLDLARTKLTAVDLAPLSGHPSLFSVNLAGTPVGDGAAGVLASLPALGHANLWHAGLTPAGVAELRAARPDLVLELGDEGLAEPLETEPPIELTRVPPATDATAETAHATGEPLNTHCPVSGKPVVAEFQLVHEGRVIGFCCPSCPGPFAADPAAYPVDN